MKRTIVLLAATAFFAACSAVFALYSVDDKGTWPKTWPAELEALRKQSRTLTGPMVAQPHYEIPFTKREEFESAWPHLLKVKSKGAPVILLRGPNAELGTTIEAGVRIHCPPPQAPGHAMPEAPLPGQSTPRSTWMYTTFIELIVDGKVVDLNRIPLPADTPIIDQRFKDRDKRDSADTAPNGGGPQPATEPRPAAATPAAPPAAPPPPAAHKDAGERGAKL